MRSAARPQRHGIVRGDGELVAKEERNGPARVPAPKRKRASGDAAGGNVGNALRSVYDQTVSEAIPGEMLDLLGKLA